MWLDKHKNKLIAALALVIILAGLFYYGGNAPGARGWSVFDPTKSPQKIEEVIETPKKEEEPKSDLTEKETLAVLETKESKKPEIPGQDPIFPKESVPSEEPPKPKVPTQEINPETGKDKYLTDPVPEGKPLPVEPQDVKIGTTAYTCSLSISCSTILNNLDLCNPEKIELVPDDGWILEPILVTFYEGESVFNVLQRTCKQLKIHMEFMNTPIYNSAYIEGINNLYEFDVGELSGWMYKVNEWFPNYGCSRYQLNEGDIIDWVYTCDLGYDVGGGYSVGP